MAQVIEPSREQILRYCADDPVERVFLEDVARRGLGRFTGAVEDGSLVALCHTGANVVPSGRGCGVFADEAVRARARMLIGEQRAVSELWDAVRRKLPRPREDRPGQPVYAISAAPEEGATGLRPAELSDLDLLVPACARAHEVELGIDPLRPRRGRLPLAHARPDRGGTLVAVGRGRRHPLQGGGVGVDARGGAAAAGLDRSRGARPGQRRAAACAT